MHKHLQRLDRVWANAPIFFVTTCTHKRLPLLATAEIAPILVEEWKLAGQHNEWSVGAYVIMPDHVHFFCAPLRDAATLSNFVAAWKRCTSRRIRAEFPRSATAATGAFWQREFFDHLLRSSESYEEKCNYVRENPVRAGLVDSAKNWPYIGELAVLRL